MVLYRHHDGTLAVFSSNLTNLHPNQMNTITDQQVESWLREKLQECIKMSPIGAVSFEAKADNFTRNGQRVTFHAYSSTLGHADECRDPNDAIEAFRKLGGAYTPQERAAKLRAEAAEKLTEAETIEAQAATL